MGLTFLIFPSCQSIDVELILGECPFYAQVTPLGAQKDKEDGKMEKSEDNTEEERHDLPCKVAPLPTVSTICSTTLSFLYAVFAEASSIHWGTEMYFFILLFKDCIVSFIPPSNCHLTGAFSGDFITPTSFMTKVALSGI
jgi:hypothetical protein